MTYELVDTPKRIGFVSTRIAGTDGVSLEIGKWADVLERMGHTCFYIAGLSDRPAEVSRLIPEAHFKHPVIDEINRHCYGRQIRSLDVSRQIHETTWQIKQQLRAAIHDFQLDLLIAENCLTIPMNIPLGQALVETLMEIDIGCIAHHHDFYWERERFMVNAVDDYLSLAFPPPLEQIQHVTINTQAARDFSRRVGLSCRVIPNVMDFDNPPPPPDDYSEGLRRALGVDDGDLLILQPTRVVQRKGIEHSIELIHQLTDPRCKLVITHSSGDEGDAYASRVLRYAEIMGVQVIFAEMLIGFERGTGPNGERLYSAWDGYQSADLVAYPSTYEGFGNAFLEAVYFKQPLLCNRYAIYRTDIEPCGFQVCLMEGFLTDDVVEHVRRVLRDEDYRKQMVEHNYEVARHYFSYARLEAELRAMLAKPRLTGHHGE
jgi:glycosyltransferase involved in cell wall biosynthesis